MEHPQTRDEVNSFLCMICPNGQFIPNLSATTANLRDLIKDNAVFQWSDAHKAEFRSLKSACAKDILLRLYDTNLPTFIHVDAHYTGLSTMLAQGLSIESSKAVSIASQTIAKVEKNYSQPNLEATAVDFGLQQVQHILIGGPPVTVITDHQPLVSLWNSQRKPPSQIERILLRHQDINHNAIWRKGIANPADYTTGMPSPLISFRTILLKRQRNTKGFFFCYIYPCIPQFLRNAYRKHSPKINNWSIWDISWLSVKHQNLTPPWKVSTRSSLSFQ